ncbi:HAD-superhydrolase, subIA, variant 3 family protein [Lactobacillus selangorensis]|uniref:HAD-superhydrolase, subIA, variant 3 family protein n=1 Tax=Lactobacillus selangorensis TaxID=81857 RepID=A0A0R2FLD5_9LACO|nr:HAD family phosphatase [Lactobacillus selangorensis]KRN29344.1 HAD-superhydrolase, subIA, variant 3 family protein [Lactobacillus selangorensis]KRN34127.1 HAD-superhydrolase, subIA, variant 3 family protein [Lactobacillus selangorensis]
MQAVIFDMDGLMFDSENLYLQANIAAGHELGLSVSKADYQKLIGTPDATMRAFYEQHFASQAQADQFIQLTYQKVDELVAAGKLKVKPGLIPLLDYLDAHQMKKIIASSNFKDTVESFLKITHLDNRFDQLVTEADVTKGKPDPQVFQIAQQKLGTPNQETLVLEDSPAGVTAAYRAKLPVIMVPDLVQPTPETLQEVTAVVPSLDFVIPWLQQH